MFMDENAICGLFIELGCLSRLVLSQLPTIHNAYPLILYLNLGLNINKKFRNSLLMFLVLGICIGYYILVFLTTINYMITIVPR